jgi:nitrogen regulatory protein P-II 1
MKEIKAIIRPSKLARVRDAFRSLHGFPGMSISRAEGCSYAASTDAPRGIKAELTEYSDAVRIDIVAPDEMVDEICRLIHQHAHTGSKGDGLLWVTPVERVERIQEP